MLVSMMLFHIVQFIVVDTNCSISVMSSSSSSIVSLCVVASSSLMFVLVHRSAVVDVVLILNLDLVIVVHLCTSCGSSCSTCTCFGRRAAKSRPVPRLQVTAQQKTKYIDPEKPERDGLGQNTPTNVFGFSTEEFATKSS